LAGFGGALIISAHRPSAGSNINLTVTTCAISPRRAVARRIYDSAWPFEQRVGARIKRYPRPHKRNCEGAPGISADTALRLARFFNTSHQFWLNLQANYDVKCAEDIAGAAIAHIQPWSLQSLGNQAAA
jgi:antitoxin HigA-1